MNNRLRKTAVLLTALSMILVSACSKEKDGAVDNQQGGNAGQKEAVTISTARVVSGDVTFKNGESIDDNVHYKWAKDKLGINLKNDWTVGTADAYTTKLRLIFSSNEKLPDVIRVGDLNLENELIDSGKVMDITDAFEKYASPRLKALFEEYPELWYSVTRDGRHYGLPVTNAVSSSSVLWIRKDWLDKLGLQEPKTIEDVEAVMDAFVNRDPDGNGQKDTIGLSLGLKDGVASGMSSAEFIFGHSGMPKSWNLGEGDSLAYGSIQPNVKQGLVKLSEWMSKGYLDQDAGTMDGSKASESFVQGKSGMIFGPVWMPSWPFTDAIGNYEAIPLPTGVDGKQGIVGEPLSSTRFYFNADFKYMEDFFKYLDAIMGPGFYDVNSEFAKGWGEGYDYVMVDGQPVYDAEKIPGGFADVKKYNLFYNDIQTPGKELEVMAKLGNGSTPETPYEIYFSSRSKKWAAASAVLSTYIKDASVTSEFTGPPTASQAQKDELLKKLEDETFLKIIYGNETAAAFDKFVSQWKTSGGDAVTKEVNDWYKSVKK